MKKILISFIGGRPLPNFQFILSEQPDLLYLISSSDAGNKEKLIQALPKGLDPVKSFDVNPYKIKDTLDCCEKILEAVSSFNDQFQIILHLSSEPKTMSIAAYQFATKKGLQNIQLFYSSRDGIIDVFNNQAEPRIIEIDLESYFSVYGWQISKKQEQNKQFDCISEFFVKKIDLIHPLLVKMRKQNRGKGKRTIKIPKLEDEEFHLLKELQALNMITSIKYEPENGASVTIQSPTADFFMSGDWLEYYVFKISQDIIGVSKFYETAWNVEGTDKKGELDFVGVTNGQLVMASCKTEDGIKAEYFKELAARADQLGKGMCTKILISSLPSPKGNSLKDHERWEKDYATRIIYGKDLKNLSSILVESIISLPYTFKERTN